MILIANLVSLAFAVYTLGLFVYVIQRWIGIRFGLRVDQMLRNAYEPFLIAIRSKVRPLQLGNARIDVSPMILFLGILIARAILITLIVAPGV